MTPVPQTTTTQASSMLGVGRLSAVLGRSEGTDVSGSGRSSSFDMIGEGGMNCWNAVHVILWKLGFEVISCL